VVLLFNFNDNALCLHHQFNQPIAVYDVVWCLSIRHMPVTTNQYGIVFKQLNLK